MKGKYKKPKISIINAGSGCVGGSGARSDCEGGSAAGVHCISGSAARVPYE